jgi:hypothetical protein
MNNGNHPILSMICDFADKERKDGIKARAGARITRIETNPGEQRPIRATDHRQRTTDY